MFVVKEQKYNLRGILIYTFKMPRMYTTVRRMCTTVMCTNIESFECIVKSSNMNRRRKKCNNNTVCMNVYVFI